MIIKNASYSAQLQLQQSGAALKINTPESLLSPVPQLKLNLFSFQEKLAKWVASSDHLQKESYALAGHLIEDAVRRNAQTLDLSTISGLNNLPLEILNSGLKEIYVNVSNITPDGPIVFATESMVKKGFEATNAHLNDKNKMILLYQKRLN